MSKPIKMTHQYLDECRRDFEKALELTKLADGKLNFTKTFTLGDRKAIVYFEPEAWAKMAMLIKEFDKEVAWHGIARRSDDESKDEYIISDIVVYPQEVTGATVEMDTEEYAVWLMENDEDERFANIHMQGHSHVNMSPNPSSVDLTHQEEILNMLGDDDFYIFMIWNKSFSSNTKVYDLKKNVLFENTDVTIKLIGAVEDLDEFLKKAKEMVKTKTYTTPSYQRPPVTPYNPLYGGQKKDEKGSGNDAKDKPRTRIGAGWIGKNVSGQGSLFDQYDDDDPYGYYRDYYGR